MGRGKRLTSDLVGDDKSEKLRADRPEHRSRTRRRLPPKAPSPSERTEALRAADEKLVSALREARRLEATYGVLARMHWYATGRLVLLADDLAEARELYGSALRFRGFQVEEARDGAEAVEKAIVLRPDVIVLDFVMPHMDGSQAFRILAAHERTQRIPVVMLSAFAKGVPPAVRFGCAGFLAKPGSPDELCMLVHQIVGARGLASPP
jgi:CheY-like chemotaxis protein